MKVDNRHKLSVEYAYTHELPLLTFSVLSKKHAEL